MIPISLNPILLMVEIGYIAFVARRWRRLEPPPRNTASIYVYLAFIAVYALVTSVLGSRGVYISNELLQWLPGLWLQAITILVCVLPLVLYGPLRHAMRRMVDVTPRHWFAYFQGLRIAALGTAYRTYTGEFPAYIEWLIGVPDLVFGLSAFWVASRVKHGRLGDRGFMVWNLIGAIIIVPAAPILLQLGLPGPLQLFTGLPDARAVFTFPMSIAPMVGVPLLVLVNLWVAWRLWERTRQSERDFHARDDRTNCALCAQR